MDQSAMLDQLRRHQGSALEVLSRGVRCLEGGKAELLASSDELRQQMGEALGAYQVFKHEMIFDPAIASADPERVALARRMKVACIRAGEVFRAHMGRWSAEQINTDWENYRPAARLTVKQLRRHISSEGEGIQVLISRYGVPSTAGGKDY